MRSSPAPAAVSLVAVLASAVVLAAGCAHRVKVDRLDDGTYRLTCSAPLDDCLHEGGANACENGGYFVVRAINDVDFRGNQDTPDPTRSSAALLRCAPQRGWGRRAQELMAEPAAALSAPASAPAPAVRAASVCAPGATQACVGAAACAGGQACLPDGSAWGPCDCGPPRTTAPAAPPPAPRPPSP